MEQIDRLEKEIADLRRILQVKEDELYRVKNEWISGQHTNLQTNNLIEQQYYQGNKMRAQIGDKLPKWAIERYSRQILLPEIGVKGQEKLCTARVLIVGAGGLGCPAAIYLAGAGVGEIGIVDYDAVDLTNIHRQFLHEEKDQFTSKAESAANKLKSLNSHIKVTAHNKQLDSNNALQIAANYDIVLDCTDNVPTRYLLNDTCILAKLPLISGSALKMEGQLTVYGYRASRNPNEKDAEYMGPCYRCVFPTPPPPEAVGSCSANGVAGPIPGVIGALQALEAIKYIVGQTHAQLLVERMLLFDGDDVTFRTVKLRPRNVNCAACGLNPAVTRLGDYEAFCNAQAKEKVSRKGDSKLYHLIYGEERLPVCRVMFLNTLGIKEAMVRCWLLNTDKPKTTKKPLKSLNVDSYIDNLPKSPPKCQYCVTNSNIKYEYITIDNIKNLFQLYNMYVRDMKERSIQPASRKTFSRVICMKNIRIFKPKNENDICDVISEHNNLPSLNYDLNNANYYYV